MKNSVPAVTVIVFCIMAAMPAFPVASAASPSRPNFDLTTDKVFDPGAVPAYRGNHDEVYAYIDEHIDQHVEALQRWVRQPSISAQNVGVVEMAEMLRDDLEAAPPAKLSDVEAAQKEILTVARRLADAGEINLGGGGGEAFI